jgi:hypothetical protein
VITESEVVALFVEANPIPITSDELNSPRSLATSVDTALVSADAEPDEQLGDEPTVDYLRQPGESTAATQQKKWSGVVLAVAATILVVVGVVVVADGNSGEVVTDPASSPGVVDSASSNELSPAPEDQSVLGEVGRQRMFSVTVGGPGLVAVGESWPTDPGDPDAAVWTSVDGLSWSRVPHDEAVFGGVIMRSVIVGGPGLVAIGDDDDDAAVWTSVDGLSWSRVRHDEAVFGGASMWSVTIGGPGLVAVGVDGVGDSGIDQDSAPGDRDAAVWTSVDGITWSRVPHDEVVFGGANDQGMLDVTVGGPGLVAVGFDGVGVIDNGGSQVAAVWTSVDGVTWSRVPEEAVTGGRHYPMWSVTAGGPGLVAVGWDHPDAAVWTSVDGTIWSRVPHDEAIFGATNHWEMVSVSAAGPGLVAVGDAVWTSVDGRAWSLSYDFDGTMWSVTAGGPGLVGVGRVGSDAAVWTSVDGITWSLVGHDEATGEAGPNGSGGGVAPAPEN